MFGIIYAGENLLTHKIYVGQTVRSLKKRIREHKNNTKSLIGRALHKYGEENFVWVILEECDSREQLDEREIYWIKTLNTKAPNGYNLTDGGEGVLGFHLSFETRAKIAASNKGKVRSAEQRARISKSKIGNKNSAGRVFTAEHCARISASKMRHPVSQETREKLSKLKKGKKLSLETRAKMSESQKRRFKKA